MTVLPVMTGHVMIVPLVMMVRPAMTVLPVMTGHVMIVPLVMMVRPAMTVLPVMTGHVMIVPLVMMVRPAMTVLPVMTGHVMIVPLVMMARPAMTVLLARAVTIAPLASLLVTSSLAPSVHRVTVLTIGRPAPNRENVLILATEADPRVTTVHVTPIPALTAPLSVHARIAPR
jgi:hypothetical protein